MKLEEIRVGNYFYDGQHKPFTVDSDHIRSFASMTFIPIPITARQLDKLNLDRQGDRDMWVSEDLKMGVSYWTKLDRFEVEGFYLTVRDKSGVIFRTTIKIEYIHQVQNFHLDFTGKQLTLK